MHFKTILLFELRYQLRRPATWLFFSIITSIAFLITRDSSLEDALYHTMFINSPLLIVKSEAVVGMLWLVIAASIAGDAGARDVQTRMHSLVYTTGINTRSYLAGKFSAALVANVILLLSLPIGSIIGVYWPGMQPEVVGPFRPAAYLTSFAYFTLPNAFFATAIQFAIALRTGSSMAGYLGSLVLVFMSYFMATLVRFYLFRDQGMLLDPLGVHVILENLGSDWTAYERKWRLLSLDGIVLGNRLLWLGVGVATLLITFSRFRFVHKAGKEKKAKRKKVARSQADLEAIVADAPLPTVQRIFDWRFSYRQTLAIASYSFRTLAKSRTGLAFLVLIPLFAMIIVIDQMHALGTPLAPVTVRVLKELVTPLSNELSRWAIVPLLTIFFAGELVWRERDHRMDAITGALPGSNWAQFGGKFIALSLILILFITCLVIAGISAQLILGYHRLEIALYIKVMFGLQVPEYLLFALLTLALHTMVNHKYIGYLVCILVYAFIALLAGMLGIEHSLLIFGAAPEWSYTNMSCFGVSLTPWLWLKAYWAAFSMLLAVVAQQFWVRGGDNNFRVRLHAANRHFTRATAITGTVALILLLSTESIILYNLHIVNRYRSSATMKSLQADYERHYRKYLRLAQPQVTSTLLSADIYPAARRVVIKGSYILTNKTGASIDNVHLSMKDADARLVLVNFTQPAKLLVNDKQHGYRIYQLTKELPAGDSIKMSFEVEVQRRGFTNRGADPSITPQATVFESTAWCPAIGYQPSRELYIASDRRDAGLPARPVIPALDDPAQSEATARKGKTNFKAMISTDSGQVAIAPGALQRSWYKGGRRYFRFVTSAPIPNSFTIFSAKYAIRTAEFNGVQIRIFHYPSHNGNLERILQSVKASLAQNNGRYGAYAYKHLNIFEHPQAAGSSLHSEPGMIWYGQGYPFWHPKDTADLDQPFAVMAHEMGHQFQVDYAFTEGAPLLSESFAWYSAMQVFEQSLGIDQLRKLRDFMLEPYPFLPEKRGEPLLRALNPYLAYRKGPFALYALSRYIGVDKVNSAFRTLRKRSALPNASLATTLDLYRELQNVTPDSLQYLLHDLFAVNTTWDLKVKDAFVKQTAAGSWQLTMTVQTRKIAADDKGMEKEVPMKDWIEMGVFASGKRGNESGKPIYFKLHYFNTNEQRVIITLPYKPSKAAIDPNHLLVDWNIRDNFLIVK